MFRGLDDSPPPSVPAAPPSDDPLKSIFQQRIEEERLRREQGDKSSSWRGRRPDADETRRLEETERAKRDAYVKIHVFSPSIHHLSHYKLLTIFFMVFSTAGSMKIT